MSGYKQYVIDTFTQLISDCETVIENSWIELHGGGRHLNSNRELNDENLTAFYALRTKFLELMTRIPSDDIKIVNTIRYIRDAEPIIFEVQQFKKIAQDLLSDYQAGLLDPLKSTNSESLLGEYKLREVLYEVEYFEAPYPKAETDRLEKIIKQAIRMTFGEDSTQFKEINSIFHPRIATIAGESEEIKQNRHIKKWTASTPELLNSLRVMLEDFQFKQMESSTNTKADMSIQRSGEVSAELEVVAKAQKISSLEVELENKAKQIEFLRTMIAIFVSVIVAIFAFYLLTNVQLVSSKNEPQFDFFSSVLVGILVAFALIKKWRVVLFLSALIPFVIAVIQTL